jgi:hypothetical protein
LAVQRWTLSGISSVNMTISCRDLSTAYGWLQIRGLQNTFGLSGELGTQQTGAGHLSTNGSESAAESSCIAHLLACLRGAGQIDFPLALVDSYAGQIRDTHPSRSPVGRSRPGSDHTLVNSTGIPLACSPRGANQDRCHLPC